MEASGYYEKTTGLVVILKPRDCQGDSSCDDNPYLIYTRPMEQSLKKFAVRIRCLADSVIKKGLIQGFNRFPSTIRNAKIPAKIILKVRFTEILL